MGHLGHLASLESRHAHMRKDGMDLLQVFLGEELVDFS